MARLIDADALKARIGELCINNDEMFSAKAYERIIGVIDAQQTVTAEPKRGRWIENGEICGIGKYKCSICGGEVGGLLDNTKYCCFCGAKMETDRIFEREVREDG